MGARLQSFLTSHGAEMFDLLRELVCIQSGTANKAGFDRACELITAPGNACSRKVFPGCRLLAASIPEPARRFP